MDTIKKLDFVGPKFQLYYRQAGRIRSWTGVVITVLISLLAFAGFIMFSKEIVFKENPITRLNKQYSESTKIYLKDFPLSFSFYGMGRNINTEIVENFEIRATYTDVDLSRVGSRFIASNLLVEPCKKEYLEGALPDEILELTLSSLCINPFYKITAEGKKIKEDVYIENDMIDNTSKFVRIRVFDRTEQPEGKILGKYNDITFIQTMLVKFTNLANFEEPLDETFYSLQTILSRRIAKTFYVNSLVNSISTDKGFIFEDIEREEFRTYDNHTVDFDIFSEEEGMLVQTFHSSPRLVNNYSREYVKLQTVFAQIGGMAKALLILGQALVYLPANYNFYVKVSKEAKFKSIVLNSSVNNSAVKLKEAPSKLKKKNKPAGLWDFASLSSKKLKENYFPTEGVTEMFDIFELNKKIEDLNERLENDKTESKVVNVRKREK